MYEIHVVVIWKRDVWGEEEACKQAIAWVWVTHAGWSTQPMMGKGMGSDLAYP